PTEPSRAATVPEWKPVSDGPGPGKVGRTPLARSLTAPKPFDGKNRAELNQYYALFDIYVDANRLQEREKIVLLEANLPVSLRMHWQFLKKQDLTFEQMKLRLAALLGGSSKHSQMTAEYNLQTMQKKYQENFFDFCTRAEKMATEAFPEDYEKMQAALKTLLVGTLQRDRYYEVGTLITAVETMDYTGLKEQVLVLEKAKVSRFTEQTTTMPSRGAEWKDTKKSDPNQCRKCLGYGHWASNCPNSKTSVNAVPEKTANEVPKRRRYPSFLDKLERCDDVCGVFGCTGASEQNLDGQKQLRTTNSVKTKSINGHGKRVRVRCWKCKEMGHLVKMCPEKKKNGNFQITRT
uniref:CCHC-type domain-containing protein n=1 Tax=Panagrellus redivivus TaxID=6233 RepID=A0A7E4W9S8_PANRE